MFTLSSSVESESPESTEAIAELFAEKLTGGQCVGLVGPLGAGKTAFTRGLARGLRVQELDEVASPTYAVMHVYPRETGGNLYHLDMYRLETWQAFVEIDGLALVSAIDQSSIVCIEWADRYPELLPYLDWLVRIEERRVGEVRELSFFCRAT